MQPLHSIIAAAVEAWVWTHIQGGNGADLGSINGRTTTHLMLVRRGQPTPTKGSLAEYGGDIWAYERNNYGRIHFVPWRGLFVAQTARQMTTPLCGPIKTQSKYPRMYAAYGGDAPYAHGPAQCPNCEQAARTMGVNPTFMRILQRDDPWTNLTPAQRMAQIDPVSGI